MRWSNWDEVGRELTLSNSIGCSTYPCEEKDFKKDRESTLVNRILARL